MHHHRLNKVNALVCSAVAATPSQQPTVVVAKERETAHQQYLSEDPSKKKKNAADYTYHFNRV
jgi:hypothetical protein